MLHRTRREWEATVCLGEGFGRGHHIVVAAVSEELMVACELYTRIGTETGIWMALLFGPLPKGLKILDTAAVRYSPGANTKLKAQRSRALLEEWLARTCELH